MTDWGEASIEKEVYDYIRKVLPDGGTILELGSGWATGELAKHYTMYSVEHDEDYLDKYDSTYIHAPLREHKKVKNHKSTLWYNSDTLKEKLEGIEYDLLLIDGPPGTRSGFVKYIGLFDLTAILLFDDTNRRLDMRVADSVATRLKVPMVKYRGPKKSFVVLNDPCLKV
jgi:hypothetical protein